MSWRRRAAIVSEAMSVLIWSMVGIAVWHFAVLVPDRFWGGIVGAFLAAWVGALTTGYLLPEPGVSTRNPPGIADALWAMPGAVLALVASYVYGARRAGERRDERGADSVA